MIRSLRNLIIILSLFSFSFAEDLALGSDIPLADVKMVDISGKKVSLNDVKMKNGLLEFYLRLFIFLYQLFCGLLLMNYLNVSQVLMRL